MSIDRVLNPITVLRSNQDSSINYIFETEQEARYVRRNDDELIVYLSSHNGCNKACRFCHLTQSGQTNFTESSLIEILAQANAVLTEYVGGVYNGKPKASVIHYNFMARGEALSSTVVTEQWQELSTELVAMAGAAGINEVKFKISTIMPSDMKPLETIFADCTHQPEIYYSFYSLDHTFRKRWMPNAMEVVQAIRSLVMWQRACSGRVVIHCAYLESENTDTMFEYMKHGLLRASGLNYDYNIVRYNPYSEQQGREAHYDTILQMYRIACDNVGNTGRVQIVDRVGFDVMASCGMFVSHFN